MPVDPVTIGSAARPFVIFDDRTCVSCGYSLTGLRIDGVCPECGRPIQRRRKNLPRYADNLINAPASWLVALSLGCTLAFVCAAGAVGSGIAVGILAAIGSGNLIAVALTAFFAAGWWVSVLFVTRRRPALPATTVNPAVEWRWFRLAARISQAFWFPTILFVAVLVRDASLARPTPSSIPVAGLLCFSVGAIGLIPLLIHASNLAFWAADSSLAQHLRVCAWTIGFAAFLAVITTVDVLTRAIPFGVLRTILFCLDYIFIFAPVLYLLYCLWGLQSIARWSLKNRAIAEARNDRLRDRASLAAQMDRPDSPQFPDPATSSRIDTEEKTYAYGEIKDQPSSTGYVVKRSENDLKPYDVDPA